MSIEVQVNTAQAQSQIEGLGKALDTLASSADTLGTKLSFKDTGLLKEFQEIRNSMRSLSDVLGKSVDALGSFKQEAAGTGAILEGVAKGTRLVVDAIAQQTNELKKGTEALREHSREEERANQIKSKAQKYIQMQWTANEKAANSLREFSKVMKEYNATTEKNKITEQQAARVREMLVRSAQSAGTEIEKLSRRLEEQTSKWGKTNTEILKTVSGYDLLSNASKKRLDYLQRTADLQARLGEYLKTEMTALQRHRQALDDLNKARMNGYLKGKEQEELYLRLKQNITRAIENEVNAQHKLNSARGKGGAGGVDREALSAQKALQKLRESMGVIPKINHQTEQFRATLSKLKSTADKLEFTRLTKLKQDMDLLGPSVARAEPPFQKFTRTVDAATRAYQAFQQTGGRMGISKNQYTQVLSSAKDTLIKTELNARRAHTGLVKLVGGFNLTSQAAAAGRAAMIGAGQSFGIFEGRTLAVAAAVYGLAKAIRTSLSVGIEFEYQMTKVTTLMKGVEKALDPRMVRAVTDEIIRLGESTQFSATEVAQAAEILARSGKDAGFIYANLENVLDLAAVAMTDMSNAADIATAVVASFGQTGYSLADAVDVLAATSVMSKATIDDLGLSLQYIGPLAAQAGISFKETASVLGTLADVNIRGSKAGTALRRMIISLTAPTERARKALGDLGIEVNKLDLSNGGLEDFFRQLNSMGLSANELQDTLRKVFGVYALSAATALTASTGKLAELNSKLDQTRGYAARMRDELRQNLKMELEELSSVWKSVQIAAFEAFGPGLTKHIQDLTGFLSENKDAIAEVISSVVNGLAEIVRWITETVVC